MSYKPMKNGIHTDLVLPVKKSWLYLNFYETDLKQINKIFTVRVFNYHIFLICTLVSLA